MQRHCARCSERISFSHWQGIPNGFPLKFAAMIVIDGEVHPITSAFDPACETESAPHVTCLFSSSVWPGECINTEDLARVKRRNVIAAAICVVELNTKAWIVSESANLEVGWKVQTFVGIGQVLGDVLPSHNGRCPGSHGASTQCCHAAKVSINTLVFLKHVPPMKWAGTHGLAAWGVVTCLFLNLMH